MMKLRSMLKSLIGAELVLLLTMAGWLHLDTTLGRPQQWDVALAVGGASAMLMLTFCAWLGHHLASDAPRGVRPSPLLQMVSANAQMAKRERRRL